MNWSRQRCVGEEECYRQREQWVQRLWCITEQVPWRNCKKFLQGWGCIKGGWKTGRRWIFGAFWAIITALDFILQAVEDQGKFACGHACHVKNWLLVCKEWMQRHWRGGLMQWSGQRMALAWPGRWDCWDRRWREAKRFQDCSEVRIDKPWQGVVRVKWGQEREVSGMTPRILVPVSGLL